MQIGLAIQDSDPHKMSHGCTGCSLKHHYTRDVVYTDYLSQDARIAVETGVDGVYIPPGRRLKYFANVPA